MEYYCSIYNAILVNNEVSLIQTLDVNPKGEGEKEKELQMNIPLEIELLKSLDNSKIISSKL